MLDSEWMVRRTHGTFTLAIPTIKPLTVLAYAFAAMVGARLGWELPEIIVAIVGSIRA